MNTTFVCVHRDDGGVFGAELHSFMDKETTKGDADAEKERRIAQLEKETDATYLDKWELTAHILSVPFWVHFNCAPVGVVVIDGLVRTTRLTAGWTRISQLEEQQDIKTEAQISPMHWGCGKRTTVGR
jgi:hypothetical protein